MLAIEHLEGAGFKVDAAGSATEAMNKLALVPGGVDAVIIDIGLPDRRGDVLVREIRALHSSLPIVLATGQAVADLRMPSKEKINSRLLRSRIPKRICWPRFELWVLALAREPSMAWAALGKASLYRPQFDFKRGVGPKSNMQTSSCFAVLVRREVMLFDLFVPWSVEREKSFALSFRIIDA